MPVAAILDRRLAAYSITAGMAIAGAAKASAAIVYTDIPDETFVLNDGAQAYILDINADGIDDFNLRFEYSTRATSAYACTNVAIRPIAAGGELLMGGRFYGPRPLHSNFTVSSFASYSWGEGNTQFGYLAHVGQRDASAWAEGNFLGRSYASIGLFIEVSGQRHYGWLRVSVAKDGRTFTVHDYGYNNSPGEPLLTGGYLLPHLEGTLGSRVRLPAGVVPGLGAVFPEPPKVTGRYIDPIKGRKLAKASFKATLDEDGSVAVLEVKKKVGLFDAKALKAAYANGEWLENLLVDEPNQGLNFTLDVTLPDKTVVTEVAQLALMPPVILFTDGTMPQPGARIVVTGNWFGVKPPKAWLEYQIPAKGGFRTKAFRLKVLKEYPFPNAKGKENASCMELDSGLSMITLQVPDAWPEGYDGDSLTHHLVIDNGIGLAHLFLEEP